MARQPDGGDPSPTSARTALELLGNETRVSILMSLWEAYDPEASDDVVSFSELFDRVAYDDSSNFNYHLQQLVGHFVRSTGDGYALTSPGMYLVQSVVAGSIDGGSMAGPVEIEADCPLCGAPIEVSYEDQYFRAECTGCVGLWAESGSEGYLFELWLPPAGVSGRTLEEAFHATITYQFRRMASYDSGVCPVCSGVVDRRIDACESHAPAQDGVCPECDRYYAVQIRAFCTRCKSNIGGPVSMSVLTHPAVTAFYWDHGIDHRFDSWDAFRRGQTIDEELLETDPLRVRVTVPCEDDRLRLTVDETLSVVDVDR